MRRAGDSDEPDQPIPVQADNETKKEKLDDFGNLVLISPGMNSEYSNKPYFVKYAEFNEKSRPDSLKSLMIFQKPTWDFSRCKEHREQIKVLFKQYYSENNLS